MNPLSTLTRRDALKGLGASALGAPMALRGYAAAPSETVLHASFGAGGMAWSDIGSLTASKNLKLVAVAEVDQAQLANVKKKFPDVKVYDDWRVLLDKEKDLDSVNVSTPDHMHAPIAMSAMLRGKHVYCQKPLTQTIYESRRLAKVAAEKKLITQMGIQIHSHEVHRTVVEIVHVGAIGKVKAVHSWSGKHWGDRANRPMRADMIPAGFNWDLWLGVAADRPFIGGNYYHPGNWRKRLDFGTGTFGDMGCHILDPVFGACGFTSPLTIAADGDGPTDDSWGLTCHVKYVFPESKYASDKCELHWYHGDARPPADVQALIGGKLNDQGSIYIGEKGVLNSPYIAAAELLPKEKFTDYAMPKPGAQDHYRQFVEAVRGNDKTSAPFSYSGPLTEMVLLGCLATRFPGSELKFDTASLKVTGNDKAQAFVRKKYRKGWEVAGL
jgi:predicted dehydrogenase